MHIAKRIVCGKAGLRETTKPLSAGFDPRGETSQQACMQGVGRRPQPELPLDRQVQDVNGQLIKRGYDPVATQKLIVMISSVPDHHICGLRVQGCLLFDVG